MRHLSSLALVLVACAGTEPVAQEPEPIATGAEVTGPTFAEDVRAICDAPTEIAEDLAAASPEIRSRLLAEHIDRQLQTEEGRELFADLATVGAAERAAMLRGAEGAPDPCVMAEHMEQSVAEAPAEPESETATVEPGGATGGGREPAAIAAAIREHINEVRYCYERQLMQDPELEGRINARFTIEPDGTVGAAEITTGIHPEVDRCVKERMQAWTFSESDGVTVVNYPFVFATDD